MTTQEQAAFDLMREALSLVVFAGEQHELLIAITKCRAALAAAKEVQPQAQGEAP